uniref:Uncharacterized protein n=1 Tax=Kalanchoe fedtschenkoi TaxID=63787 RepID=A0A7N0VJT2_KALFE
MRKKTLPETCRNCEVAGKWPLTDRNMGTFKTPISDSKMTEIHLDNIVENWAYQRSSSDERNLAK